MLLINEEQNYFGLRKNINLKDNQLGNIERHRLIEHGKKFGQNERQGLKHKTDVKD